MYYRREIVWKVGVGVTKTYNEWIKAMHIHEGKNKYKSCLLYTSDAAARR